MSMVFKPSLLLSESHTALRGQTGWLAAADDGALVLRQPGWALPVVTLEACPTASSPPPSPG